jgi:hypothetical protein
MRQVGVALAVCLAASTFAAGQGNDAPGRTLDLIKSYQALGTLEWHGPKLDVYLNAGAEYAGRAADFDHISGKYVGYGSSMFHNSGCFTEIAPTVNNGFTPAGLASCTADTRVLIEGTFGIWFKPYDGSREKVNRGRIQWDRSFPT